ncbi:MAG: hypothetical protein RLZZ53_887 [Acidobacteriota bacterium]|jgi:tetratricopeptide (TPR) repeat protein
MEMATLLTNLARIERFRGRANEASAAAREALELRRAQAPNTLLVASSATEFGLAREAARAYDEALTLHREALAIREKLATNSGEVAANPRRMICCGRSKPTHTPAARFGVKPTLCTTLCTAHIGTERRADAAVLRWNACVRLFARHPELKVTDEERTAPVMLE